MSFAPTTSHSSKACPGSTFVLRRMGFSRRVDLDMETLAYRQRLREIQLAYPPLSDREAELIRQLEEAKKKANAVPDEEFAAVMEADVIPLQKDLEALATPDDQQTRRRLDAEFAAVKAYVSVQWIRAGLVGISGGEVDGMTAEQLLDYGPPELAREIFDVLDNDGHLTGEQTKNSQSLSTSPATVDGKQKSTGAVVAPSTPEGTASASTPAV